MIGTAVIQAFLLVSGSFSIMSANTITAIIEVESSWDQSAQSRYGAYGLMQVTAGAVIDYNKRWGTQLTLGEIIKEPIFNVMVGIDHLSQNKEFGKEGMIKAYFTGRKRYMEMVRGEADYLVDVVNDYYQKVKELEDELDNAILENKKREKQNE